MHSQKLLKELTEREAALKEQLTLYTAKYDDFQSSLQKSNDIFATYKVELERVIQILNFSYVVIFNQFSR